MKNKFSRIFGVGLAVALLTSLLVTAIPASAISGVTVSFPSPAALFGTDDVISTINPDYVILFTLGKELGSTSTANATITVSFPSDTTVNATSTVGPFTGGTATISATSGWIGGVPDQPAVLTSTNWTACYNLESVTRTINYTLTTGDKIGEGAQVRIAITAGLTNPTTAGSYTLTVGTYYQSSVIPIEVPQSATYNIVSPYLAPLGGLVQLYNPAGVLMSQWLGSTAIVSALTYAQPLYTIKVGPGTYSGGALDVADSLLTIMATGTAAETIIGGLASTALITIANLDKVTIQGVTIYGSVVATNATNGLVKDCVIKGGIFGPSILVNVDSIAFAAPLTLSGDSIAATGVVTTGVDIDGATVTVSGCTFTADLGGTAIDNTGTLNVMNSTFTGSSGTGIVNGSGVDGVSYYTLISGSTFDSLENALVVNGGTSVSLSSSTIKKSTKDAIKVVGPAISGVVITGNTISDTAGGVYPDYRYALNVYSAASGNVSMLYNSLTGNVYNVKAETAGVAVDATHNWWGAATGPAAGTIMGGTTALSYPFTGIDTRYYLGASATTSTGVAVNSLSGTLTVFSPAFAKVIEVATTPVAAFSGKMAGASLSANPMTVAPPYTALANGYYDVYVTAPASSVTNILIKFYNAKVTADTKVYVWSTLEGKWVKAAATTAYAISNPAFLPQGVNTMTGYAYVSVVSTGTVPDYSGLGGTPFVLVEEKTMPSAPTLSSPALGAYNISVEPMFVWSTVAGAIRYQFALSEDPTFAILKWSANVNTTMYDSPETLRYSTTYYWRVRGLTAEPYLVGPAWVTPATDWATGIFTTEAEPVPEVAPVIEVPAAKVDVTVEPAKVTVEPSPPVIPDYMLWVIICIGAVLVIALIVLIVRTRRA